MLTEPVRNAADSIIGNIDDNGYLIQPLEEIADMGDHSLEDLQAALKIVQSLDPSGVAQRLATVQV